MSSQYFQLPTFGTEAIDWLGKRASQASEAVLDKTPVGTVLRTVKTTQQKIEKTARTVSRIPKQIKASKSKLDKIYDLLGSKDFPFELPKTLLNIEGQDELIKLESYAELFEWFIKNFDALMGQFPVEFQIEDNDPLKEGKQPKKVQLANVAEVLTEMFGMGLNSQTNSALSVEFLSRLAAEAIAIKNIGLITQDYVRANAEYLGYKGEQVNRSIDYAFNPTTPDTPDKLLRNSSHNLLGWAIVDKNSAADYFTRLMFSAGIIKQVFFRRVKDEEQVLSLLSGINTMTGDMPEGDSEWLEFIQRINDPQSAFNRYGRNPQPKVEKEANDT